MRSQRAGDEDKKALERPVSRAGPPSLARCREPRTRWGQPRGRPRACGRRLHHQTVSPQREPDALCSAVMYGDDYRRSLRRLCDMLGRRPDDPDIKAFENSEDGQRALEVLMAYVQLLTAVRDGDDARVREIREQLPEETFDHLFEVAQRSAN